MLIDPVVPKFVFTALLGANDTPSKLAISLPLDRTLPQVASTPCLNSMPTQDFAKTLLDDTQTDPAFRLRPSPVLTLSSTPPTFRISMVTVADPVTAMFVRTSELIPSDTRE